jgi:predicted membrane protein
MINLFDPFYYGVILIIFGLFAVMKALFGITIPVFRIGFGALLTYAGMCALLGPLPTNDLEKRTFMLEKSLVADQLHRSYNTLFGQTTIDFSNLAIPDTKRVFEINNVFGIVELILNPEIPTRIIVERAFGPVQIAGEETKTLAPFLPIPTLFGTYCYNSHADEENALIEIRSRNVFGSLAASYPKPQIS